MSVRKRSWVTSGGEQREAWIVDYRDSSGERHIQTFARKKDADAHHSQVRVDIKAGVHIAPSKSPTVQEASEGWLCSAKAHGLERATIQQYREHVNLHITPLLGGLRLSEVGTSTVRRFEDLLREKGTSPAMVRKLVASLGSLLADAQERGLSARNAVRDLHRNRRRGLSDKRQKRKLKVGVDIPTPQEITAILANAKGRWRPLLVTAAFTGLRASELRGLRWGDVDLKANELHVHQRADRYNVIGPPKSAASIRTVPFGTMLANTLKEWKLACPKGELDLVFPNTIGKIEVLSSLVEQGLRAAQPGGVKYKGMHCLRHFYASWCIDRNLPPKVIQEHMGHSSITMTFDRYGHLFPRRDDAKEIDQAERTLLS